MCRLLVSLETRLSVSLSVSVCLRRSHCLSVAPAVNKCTPADRNFFHNATRLIDLTVSSQNKQKGPAVTLSLHPPAILRIGRLDTAIAISILY